MAQPIERILVRHLGSRLTVPLFLIDPEGTLVFYNEAAERLLGRRFDDAGEMTFDAWTTAFAVRDERGQPIEIDEIALVKALRKGRPALRPLRHHRAGRRGAHPGGSRVPAAGPGWQPIGRGGALLGG